MILVLTSALYSLTGCGSVSNIGTKSAAQKVVKTHANSLSDFGKIPLDDNMLNRTERFLVDCIKRNSSPATMFDQLRMNKYFNFKSKHDFTKIPCTSTSIHLHISRAYYLCRLGHRASVKDAAVPLSTEDYGYKLGNDKMDPLWTYSKA